MILTFEAPFQTFHKTEKKVIIKQLHYLLLWNKCRVPYMYIEVMKTKFNKQTNNTFSSGVIDALSPP